MFMTILLPATGFFKKQSKTLLQKTTGERFNFFRKSFEGLSWED
jgi:hypothetical protein